VDPLTGGRWHQPDPDRCPGRIEDANGAVVVYDEGSPTDAEAEHIALHDPARVLAEVVAKRRILDEHEIESKPEPDRFVRENLKVSWSGDLRTESWTGGSWQPTGRTLYACVRCDQGYELFFDECEGCETIRLLALPYAADRPGYRDEWRL
jgi:hypothetical protein